MQDYLNILKLKIKSIRVTPLVNEEGSEKWRIGGGHEKYLPYFRIDLGSKGWRFTSTFDWTERYYADVFSGAPETVKQALNDRELQLRDNPNVKTYVVTRNSQVIREVVGLHRELYYYGKQILRDYYKT